MAKAKRNSKHEQELICKEYFDSTTFITEKEPRKVDHPSENDRSTQSLRGSTKRVRELVENFEIFCAARGFYGPEVEDRFDDVRDLIRDREDNPDRTSMSDIGDGFEAVIVAIQGL